MALCIFAFHDRPQDFAITRANVPVRECPFLLDFGRPLIRVKLLRVGPVRCLLVPVAHQGEHIGGYTIVVKRGEPHFEDIPTLWELYAARPRTAVAGPGAEGLEVLADFAKHFPTDAVNALIAGPWRA
jgi:hypothetical protein